MCFEVVKFNFVLCSYRIKAKVLKKQMDLSTVFKYKTKQKKKRGRFVAI